jgi:ADP-ribosylglycohydrolase
MSRASVLGSFVADAAAVGFHWLYDQSRIASLCPSPASSAFHPPNKADYENTMGYFVGEDKPPGSLSHYGWGLRVMVNSLDDAGHYDRQSLLDEFSRTFGYGGRYFGYIDTPTRQVLDTMAQRKRDAEVAVHSLASCCGSAQDQHMMVVKANGALAKYGRDLAAGREYCEKAIRATHNEDRFVKFGLDVFDLFARPRPAPGADDAQLPALAKVPAVVAHHLLHKKALDAVELEDSVRALNNNDEAVSAALAVARALEVVVAGGTTEQAVQAFAAVDPQTMEKARAFKGTLEEAAEHFGKACPLKNSLPVIAVFLTRLDDLTFRQAVEHNIRAAGDNCGRAIAIGALWGAKYGVGGEKGIPTEWIDKLDHALVQRVNKVF